MIQHVVNQSNPARSLVAVGILSLFSIAAVIGSPGRAQTPPAAAPATDAAPRFEVASIRPVKEPNPNRIRDHKEGRHFITAFTSLNDLILMAYHVSRQQIVGGPSWVGSDEYDIDALSSQDARSDEQLDVKLQNLLADRFQLAIHHEQRDISVYTLTVAKGGSKLKPSDPNSPVTSSGCQHLGNCQFRGEPMVQFARWMGFAVLAKPVNDHTGLDGKYDFDLTWTPDQSQFIVMGIHVSSSADNPNAPPELFTAIQEQLGLKLEPQKVASDVIVIDHVERPSEN